MLRASCTSLHGVQYLCARRQQGQHSRRLKRSQSLPKLADPSSGSQRVEVATLDSAARAAWKMQASADASPIFMPARAVADSEDGSKPAPLH
jgi:hypothetical protein